MENDEGYSDVPLTWEDESEAAKKLLDEKILEAKLKQLKQQEEEENMKKAMNGATDVERRSSDLGMGGGVGVIRILKRPESAGNLGVSPSASKISSANTKKILEPYAPAAAPASASSASNNNIGVKSLQDRVTAYAQARQRIFGAVDPVIHEDLPLPPKIVPRLGDQSSEVPTAPTTGAFK